MNVASGFRRSWGPSVLRFFGFVLIAAAAGTLLNAAGRKFDSDRQPAGFVRGMVEALMPMAWPNLLAGRDVRIYSAKNVGIHYKLGYTLGVNVCGAVFFGGVYWRLSRWRNVGRGTQNK